MAYIQKEKRERDGESGGIFYLFLVIRVQNFAFYLYFLN